MLVASKGERGGGGHATGHARRTGCSQRRKGLTGHFAPWQLKKYNKPENLTAASFDSGEFLTAMHHQNARPSSSQGSRSSPGCLEGPSTCSQHECTNQSLLSALQARSHRHERGPEAEAHDQPRRAAGAVGGVRAACAWPARGVASAACALRACGVRATQMRSAAATAATPLACHSPWVSRGSMGRAAHQ